MWGVCDVVIVKRWLYGFEYVCLGQCAVPPPCLLCSARSIDDDESG